MHSCLRLLWFQEISGLFMHCSCTLTPAKLLGAKVHQAGRHGVEEAVVQGQMLLLMVAVLLMRVKMMKMRMRMRVVRVRGAGTCRGREAMQWRQAWAGGQEQSRTHGRVIWGPWWRFIVIRALTLRFVLGHLRRQRVVPILIHALVFPEEQIIDSLGQQFTQKQLRCFHCSNNK